MPEVQNDQKQKLTDKAISLINKGNPPTAEYFGDVVWGEGSGDEAKKLLGDKGFAAAVDAYKAAKTSQAESVGKVGVDEISSEGQVASVEAQMLNNELDRKETGPSNLTTEDVSRIQTVMDQKNDLNLKMEPVVDSETGLVTGVGVPGITTNEQGLVVGVSPNVVDKVAPGIQVAGDTGFIELPKKKNPSDIETGMKLAEDLVNKKLVGSLVVDADGNTKNFYEPIGGNLTINGAGQTETVPVAEVPGEDERSSKQIKDDRNLNAQLTIGGLVMTDKMEDLNGVAKGKLARLAELKRLETENGPYVASAVSEKKRLEEELVDIYGSDGFKQVEAKWIEVSDRLGGKKEEPILNEEPKVVLGGEPNIVLEEEPQIVAPAVEGANEGEPEMVLKSGQNETVGGDDEKERIDKAMRDYFNLTVLKDPANTEISAEEKQKIADLRQYLEYEFGDNFQTEFEAWMEKNYPSDEISKDEERAGEEGKKVEQVDIIDAEPPKRPEEPEKAPIIIDGGSLKDPEPVPAVVEKEKKHGFFARLEAFGKRVADGLEKLGAEVRKGYEGAKARFERRAEISRTMASVNVEHANEQAEKKVGETVERIRLIPHYHRLREELIKEFGGDGYTSWYEVTYKEIGENGLETVRIKYEKDLMSASEKARERRKMAGDLKMNQEPIAA